MRSGRSVSGPAWWIIALIGAVDAIWIGLTEFEIATSGLLLQAIGLATLGGLAWFYSAREGGQTIATTLLGTIQLILFTVVAAPLSYLCASLGGPLWDSTLHSWDRALGFDWPSYLAWVNGYPLLGLVFNIAYGSLLVQMVLVCVVLGFTGQVSHLRTFLLATILSGVLSILISAVMPAVAMFVHLGLTPEDFPNLAPGAAYVHLADIQGLRDGTLRVLNVADMEGIITFPSYHAALGLILAAALWTIPVLRWPGVALNLTLIAATPIDGGHYFVDIGAGLIIAGLCLAAARYLEEAPARQWNGTLAGQHEAENPAL